MEFNFKDYLKKFEKFLPRETQVKNVVIIAVREVVGVTLERSQIAAPRGVVFIMGSAALKSEIAMKQGKILLKIKELAPEMTIEKIY